MTQSFYKGKEEDIRKLDLIQFQYSIKDLSTLKIFSILYYLISLHNSLEGWLLCFRDESRTEFLLQALLVNHGNFLLFDAATSESCYNKIVNTKQHYNTVPTPFHALKYLLTHPFKYSVCYYCNKTKTTTHHLAFDSINTYYQFTMG